MRNDELQVNGGSFRDPSGSVFQHEGGVYRTVNPIAAAAYEFSRDSGCLDKLLKKKWIPSWSEVDTADWGKFQLHKHFEITPTYVLKHEKVPFISYPYEWTFQQLKDAALRHLEIQLEALKHQVALSDSSSYNMQFVGPRPIHIDLLSFRPYVEGEIWVGYDQFCRHFLYPLLFEAYTGVQFNSLLASNLEGIQVLDLYKLLPFKAKYLSLHCYLHVVLRAKVERKAHRLDELDQISKKGISQKRLAALLQDMQHWITGLKTPLEGTYWSDYADVNSYSDEGTLAKLELIRAFVEKHKPETVIDLGGNSGQFSKEAVSFGAGRSIVVDADISALQRCHNMAKAEKLNLTPLFMSLTDTSADRGWDQNERAGFNVRAKSDAVFALALVHHLSITGNVPFPSVIRWIMGRAPRGIIEFVPKTDVMVKRMLATREDIFDNYSLDVMKRVIEESGFVVSELLLKESGRVLIEYEGK